MLPDARNMRPLSPMQKSLMDYMEMKQRGAAAVEAQNARRGARGGLPQAGARMQMSPAMRQRAEAVGLPVAPAVGEQQSRDMLDAMQFQEQAPFVANPQRNPIDERALNDRFESNVGIPGFKADTIGTLDIGPAQGQAGPMQRTYTYEGENYDALPDAMQARRETVPQQAEQYLREQVGRYDAERDAVTRSPDYMMQQQQLRAQREMTEAERESEEQQFREEMGFRRDQLLASIQESIAQQEAAVDSIATLDDEQKAAVKAAVQQGPLAQFRDTLMSERGGGTGDFGAQGQSGLPDSTPAEAPQREQQGVDSEMARIPAEMQQEFAAFKRAYPDATPEEYMAFKRQQAQARQAEQRAANPPQRGRMGLPQGAPDFGQFMMQYGPQ